MMRNSKSHPRNDNPDFAEYMHCDLCPRQCGVNRLAGEIGFCGESSACRVAFCGAHFGEEPPICGVSGSGTLFFSGCSCGCFFCQNYQLSQEHLGDILSFDELFEQALALSRSGVHNLNFVTPEHWWPHLRLLCRHLRAAGVTLPFVWNSSGYSRVEMLAEQCQEIDIFLPDFKFADSALADRCLGRPDYPEIALSGLRLLVERKGFLRPFDSSGEIPASCGVMVRHLVLPGELENSRAVLRGLAREFGAGLPLALMRQYTPMPECERRQFLNRKVTDEEYAEVCALAEEFGFRRLFTQEEDDGSFIPDFRQRQQPFAGNLQRGE
ncbi:MAG: radical SAM protein [Lentisphaeria bacterium]